MQRTLCFMALTFVLGACAYDPIGSCQSQCANAVARECRPMDTNCVDLCAGEQEAYDAQREVAERVGCAAEFDARVACQASADACATNPCLVDASALAQCIGMFCTSNPSDPACMM